MGDYSSVSVTLYGLDSKKKKRKVLEGIVGELNADWGTETVLSIEDLKDGVECVGDMSLGLCLDGELNYLQELGVSYYATQDGAYEFPGACAIFTPELGEFRSDAFESTPIIDANEIDALLSDDSLGTPEIRERFAKLTGKAHREAWQALYGKAAA